MKSFDAEKDPPLNWFAVTLEKLAVDPVNEPILALPMFAVVTFTPLAVSAPVMSKLLALATPRSDDDELMFEVVSRLVTFKF